MFVCFWLASSCFFAFADSWLPFVAVMGVMTTVIPFALADVTMMDDVCCFVIVCWRGGRKPPHPAQFTTLLLKPSYANVTQVKTKPLAPTVKSPQNGNAATVKHLQNVSANIADQLGRQSGRTTNINQREFRGSFEGIVDSFPLPLYGGMATLRQRGEGNTTKRSTT